MTAFVVLTRGALPPADRGRTRSLARLPREAPSRVRRVIGRGLAPNASERYQSAAAMVDVLEVDEKGALQGVVSRRDLFLRALLRAIGNGTGRLVGILTEGDFVLWVAGETRLQHSS